MNGPKKKPVADWGGDGRSQKQGKRLSDINLTDNTAVVNDAFSDIDLEREISGHILTNPQSHDPIFHALQRDCFDDPAHRETFGIAAKKWKKGDEISPLSLISATGKKSLADIRPITENFSYAIKLLLKRRRDRAIGDVIRRAKEAEEKGDIDGALAEISNAQNLTSDHTLPEIVTAESERTADIPPRRWFIDLMITVGVILLTAKKGIGKSFFILQAAIAIASGRLFLGRKTESVKTLYVPLELDRVAIHERLHRYGEVPENLFISYSWPRGDDAIRAIEHAAAQGFEVIILDMFSAIIPPGMETNSYDMTPFLLKIRRTAHRLGIAVIGLWHNSKADREDPMLAALGTTGLAGQSDCVLVLDRKRGDSKTKLFIGGNHGAESYLNLWFEDCMWSLSDADDPERECRPGDEPVLKFLREQGPHTAPHIAAVIGKSDSSIRSSLSRLSDARLVVKEGREWCPITPELFDEN